MKRDANSILESPLGVGQFAHMPPLGCQMVWGQVPLGQNESLHLLEFVCFSCKMGMMSLRGNPLKVKNEQAQQVKAECLASCMAVTDTGQTGTLDTLRGLLPPHRECTKHQIQQQGGQR